MQEIDRTRRVGELIRRELSILIAREVDDRRVRMVSVTAVTVSRDLKQATVYVSGVGGISDSTKANATTTKANATTAADIEQTLNHAAKYLRYLLGRQLRLRVTPALVFQYDHSIRRGVEMTTLIDTLNHPHASS